MPEEMCSRFPTLSLEHIYATILYYLHNKKNIDIYLANWLEHGERMHQLQSANPTSTMLKLRGIRKKQQTAKAESA